MRNRNTLIVTAFCLAVVPPTAGADDQTVTIRGDEFVIWPFEDLIQRGFDITPIPRAENAAWVYIDAVNAFEDLPEDLDEAFNYAAGTAWPKGQKELETYLDLPGNRRAIDLVRKAAGMKRYQMPCFGDRSGSVLGVLLPNLSNLRFLGKLMLVESRRLGARGRYEDAIAFQVTAMRIGGHVAEGVTLIDGLVGVAIWATAERAIQDAVLRDPLLPKHAKRLQQEMTTLAPVLPTVRRGLVGEKAFGPAVVDDICSRPLHIVANLRATSGVAGDDDFWAPSVSGNPSDGWGRLEQRIGHLIFPDRTIKGHMQRYYDKVLEKADRGPVAAAAMAFDEERYIRDKIPKWDVLSRVLLPSLSRAITLGDRSRAEFAATRALIAIRLYMLENDGETPAGLDEIEQTLPEGALIDPFSGGLLAYRRTDHGFVLYSVGPNLTDDGGRRGQRWDELDMVYTFPPEPVESFDAHGEEE